MAANSANPQSDDEACGRLWEVYVQEAQQYDEGLVKSWKEDMDVTLVFSGLYSAVLTAFVIESYQKLQQNPADVSAVLLRQISEQLSALSQNGQNATLPGVQESFAPPASAIACNVLWFMSLVLALCCAFLATFVQQWSRQFLHKTGLLRSSTAHARLFSFLYFGLKDFGMHTVVTVIPSLLHLSLFLFLGGLVAFLHDVNTVLTWLIVGALSVVAIAYIGFTVWPVIALNSPYQTPFSPLAWRVWQLFDRNLLPPVRKMWVNSEPNATLSVNRIRLMAARPLLPITRYTLPSAPKWQWLKSSKRFIVTVLRALPLPLWRSRPTVREKTPTLSDEIMEASQRDPIKRDAISITWALASLTDDIQLLPFVEALPDTLYGPNGLRESNFYLVKPVLETTDPQLDIIARIASLMANAGNSWFDDKHRERCRTACSKALWVLAFMLTERPSYFDLATTSRTSWFPRHVRDTIFNTIKQEPHKHPHAVSAFALCELNVTAYIYERIKITQTGIDSTTQALFDDETCDQTAAPHTANTTVQALPMQVETLAATRSHRAISLFVKIAVDDLAFEEERTSQAITSFLAKHNRLGAFVNIGPVGLNKLTRRFDRTVTEASIASRIPMFDSIVTIWLHLGYKRHEDIESAIEYIGKRAQLNGWTSTEKIWKASPRGSKALLSLLRNDDSVSIGTQWCNAVREYMYIHTRAQDTQSGIYRTDDLEEFWGIFALKLFDGRRANPKEPSDVAIITVVAMIAMRGILVDKYADKFERPSIGLVRLFEYLSNFEPLLGESSKLFHDGPSLDHGSQASLVAMLSTQLIRRFRSALASPEMMKDIRDVLEYTFYIITHNDLFKEAAVNNDIAQDLSKYTEDMCRWWKDAPSDDVNWDILEIIMITWHLWHSFGGGFSIDTAKHLKNAADFIRTGESMQKIHRLQRSGRASRPSVLPLHPMTYNLYFVESEAIKSVKARVNAALAQGAS